MTNTEYREAILNDEVDVLALLNEPFLPRKAYFILALYGVVSLALCSFIFLANTAHAETVTGYARSPAGSPVDKPLTLSIETVDAVDCQNTGRFAFLFTYDDGHSEMTALYADPYEPMTFDGSYGNVTSVAYVKTTLAQPPTEQCVIPVEEGTPAFVLAEQEEPTPTSTESTLAYAFPLAIIIFEMSIIVCLLAFRK